VEQSTPFLSGPHFSPDRGCVVLDQPQRTRLVLALRLVFDTAAVRHPADTFELVVENSIQREGNPQIQTLDMFRRPSVPNESSDRLNFLLVRRAATAGSA